MSVNLFCYIFCVRFTSTICFYFFCFILSCSTCRRRNISTTEHNGRVTLRICLLTDSNSTLLTTCFSFVAHRNIAILSPRRSTCRQRIGTIRYRTHTNSYRSFCIRLYCRSRTDSCSTKGTHTNYRVSTDSCTQSCCGMSFHTDNYGTRLTICRFIGSRHTTTY